MNAGVIKDEHENLDKALRRLKHKIKDADLWPEWEDAQEYTKPSKRRRNERHAAKKRNAERMASLQPRKAEEHKID